MCYFQTKSGLLWNEIIDEFLFLGRERQLRMETVRSVLRCKGGGIAMSGNTSLISIQPSLTAGMYVDLVQEPIVRFWRCAVGEILIFMHDNAPPHTSGVSKDFLKTDDITVHE